MTLSFSADEVFEIAEAIESNGARFYREAAAIAGDDEVQDMLLELALMEDVHEVNFKEMRQALSDLETFSKEVDPDHKLNLYLRAMAELNGTEGKIHTTQTLTGDESVREILEIALDAEKNSIVFYLNLKEYVPYSRGKEQIDKIINEELSHVTLILETLKLYSEECDC